MKNKVTTPEPIEFSNKLNDTNVIFSFPSLSPLKVIVLPNSNVIIQGMTYSENNTFTLSVVIQSGNAHPLEMTIDFNTFKITNVTPDWQVLQQNENEPIILTYSNQHEFEIWQVFISLNRDFGGGIAMVGTVSMII